MTTIIVELAKYAMILLMAFYTLHGFIVFRYSTEQERSGFYVMQNIFMVLIHFTGYLVLYLIKEDPSILFLFGMQEVLLFALIILFRVIYPRSNRLIINNMCMLLVISFIILCRLSEKKCIKQFWIVAFSAVIALLLPMVFKELTFLRKLSWGFGGLGILILGFVLILGRATYGSKISFTISGLTFQPSEFVKILFVFAVAGLLYEKPSFLRIVLCTCIAALHVGVLALSKDLGSALIFFVVYVVMLYAATCNFFYFLAGFAGGAAACRIGYRLFSHVRIRFIAWRDPWSYIDGEGYQITQSLFAIGTGGWFGMGLMQGSPEKIPVVEADFIFSAIAEEMGCFFGICVILVCISNFLMFMNIATKMKDNYFRLIALGISVLYGFQMFLTIGGVTRFIPLTGVTLPLVSYGGTSVLVTMIMFSLIQGIYIMRFESPERKMETDPERNRSRKAIAHNTLTRKDDHTDYFDSEDDFEYYN